MKKKNNKIKIIITTVIVSILATLLIMFFWNSNKVDKNCGFVGGGDYQFVSQKIEYSTALSQYAGVLPVQPFGDNCYKMIENGLAKTYSGTSITGNAKDFLCTEYQTAEYLVGSGQITSLKSICFCRKPTISC